MKTGWHKPAQKEGAQNIDKQGAMGEIGAN
jgi:hypothetical protein